jgi:glycosyltransferase involved in cell wall biosynthesis
MIKVSVVVPCFNEEHTITLLLDALNNQTYPREQMEVIVADGLSTDNTRENIATFQQNHSEMLLQVLDNPTRRIPAGLNLAINHAKGEFIVRLDAHSVPNENYIQRSIANLEKELGWNAGGVWDIRPASDSWIAQSIALAAAHPMGVGDARYRYTEKAGAVKTVPFGAFKRSLIDEIGPFDESLLANEDYEFNLRIRQAGGTLWLDPTIRSIYLSRPTFLALARQYARYGYWKWQMLKRYPSSLRWRQALPPLFVLSLLLLPILALYWPALIILWNLEVVSYVLLLLIAGLYKGLQISKPWPLIGLPLAIMSMHISWGSAFLWSMLRTGFRKV